VVPSLDFFYNILKKIRENIELTIALFIIAGGGAFFVFVTYWLGVHYSTAQISVGGLVIVCIAQLVIIMGLVRKRSVATLSLKKLHIDGKDTGTWNFEFDPWGEIYADSNITILAYSISDEPIEISDVILSSPQTPNQTTRGYWKFLERYTDGKISHTEEVRRPFKAKGNERIKINFSIYASNDFIESRMEIIGDICIIDHFGKPHWLKGLAFKNILRPEEEEERAEQMSQYL
jgi:hypothetical protein